MTILQNLFMPKNLRNLKLRWRKKRGLIFLINKTIKKGRRKHQRKEEIRENNRMMMNKQNFQSISQKIQKEKQKKKSNYLKSNNRKKNKRKGRKEKIKSIMGTMTRMRERRK